MECGLDRPRRMGEGRAIRGAWEGWLRGAMAVRGITTQIVPEPLQGDKRPCSRARAIYRRLRSPWESCYPISPTIGVGAASLLGLPPSPSGCDQRGRDSPGAIRMSVLIRSIRVKGGETMKVQTRVQVGISKPGT